MYEIDYSYPKKSTIYFWVINIFSIPIGIIAFLFIPLWVMLLIPLIITFMVLTARYSIKQRDTGVFQNKLNPCRIILITLAVLYLMPTAFILGFSNNKYAYGVKKYYYSDALSGNEEKVSNLPKKLPKIVTDYYFRTETLIMPDYHSGGYLMFRTDSATIAELEEECKAKGGQIVPFGNTFEELKNTDLKEFADDVEAIRESKLYYFINYRKAPYNFQRVLPDRFLDDLSDNSSIYSIKEDNFHRRYIYSGYLFDYDSGIVIIWG